MRLITLSRLCRFGLFLAGAGLALAQTPARSYDVRAFGATGDGTTPDTGAINQAIDAAAAAGGGTVVFPAGTYVSYSIHLKSNIALYLDAGATLLAADPPPEGQPGGYDAPEPNPGTDRYEDFGHAHWHNSLIWGENLENIAILGPGRIVGKGLSRGYGRKDPMPGEPRPPRPPRANGAARRGHRHRPLRLSQPARHARRRHRQQGDRAQELPQRHLARLHHLPRRPLRHPRHRRRQLHVRQPEDRHQPRRHGHRLLPERPGVQLHGQLAQ